MNPKDKYSLQEWAQFFVLASIAAESRNNKPIQEWISQHSTAHNLPQPSGNDIKYLVEEALQFLEKFSENHIDNMYNR